MSDSEFISDIPKAYTPSDHERLMYEYWEREGLFAPKKSTTNERFSIALPPPNATGELHIGHAMMLALQDIMTRYHRMRGDETLWLPGIDHAAIATQNKVEGILLKKGIRRADIGREGLLKEIHEYIATSRATIESQIRSMGASCDWSRERYTLDPGLSRAVRIVFSRMYKDGLIYRGERIVHWCIRCASTLADDEVEYKEQDGELYYIKYGPLTVATTRPETKLGDTALAVHPDDERYAKYVGKTLEVESADGPISIKVIADAAVDKEFGTGIIKVTPAHDMTDFEIGARHALEVRQVIGEDGRMTALSGKYAGMKVKECRTRIVADLESKGLIEKVEPHHYNVTVCYRCGTPIEPLVSKQWFVDVHKKAMKWNGKKCSLREAASTVVSDGSIEIVPERFKKIYFHWMDTLHDWCISRQIWFGHRVPVWYCDACEEIIVEEDDPTQCPKCSGKALTQDSDTLDTWFSSSLWTFSTLGWPDDTEDFKKFHPTSVMETGYDIIFFWVARMILMTTYAVGDIPFKTVYLHGLVRDKQGRKMSKSLGNGIDPVAMITKFGADAVRLSLVMGTTPGQDIRLYEEKIAGHRNFINKVWNICRYVLARVSEPRIVTHAPEPQDIWDSAMLTSLDGVVRATTACIDNYKFSQAAEGLLEFTWHEFADWYIEVAKVKGGKDEMLLYCTRVILSLLHPFTPFVTEVLWKNLHSEQPLIVSSWPEARSAVRAHETGNTENDLREVRVCKDFIVVARQYKAEHAIAPKEFLKVYPREHADILVREKQIVDALARVDIVEGGVIL